MRPLHRRRKTGRATRLAGDPAPVALSLLLAGKTCAAEAVDAAFANVAIPRAAREVPRWLPALAVRTIHRRAPNRNQTALVEAEPLPSLAAAAACAEETPVGIVDCLASDQLHGWATAYFACRCTPALVRLHLCLLHAWDDGAADSSVRDAVLGRQVGNPFAGLMTARGFVVVEQAHVHPTAGRMTNLDSHAAAFRVVQTLQSGGRPAPLRSKPRSVTRTVSKPQPAHS